LSIYYNEMNHAVLGSGPMGLIVSSILSRKLEVVYLWIPESVRAEEMKKSRMSELLKIPFRIEDNIQIVNHFQEFERNSWCFHIAVPSRSLEETIHQLLESLDKDNEFLFCLFTKGLVSTKTRRKLGIQTFSGFIKKAAENYGLKSFGVAVINGPSLLQELVEENHSFLNIGSDNHDTNQFLSNLYQLPFIHPTSTQSIESMEIAGIMKNPIAIAIGIVSALPNCGSNLEGELLRMGFQEMLSFAKAYNLSIEEFMGRSGLADLITTSTSSKSRNRNYGRKIVGELITGPEKLSLKDRIEIWISPKSFIEKEVSKWHDTVEGGFALGSILDLATEKKLTLPLYQTLFEVLSRKIPPIAIVNLLTGEKSEFPLERWVGLKKQGMDIAAGYNFQTVLEERILKSILSESGFLSRIKKQSHSISDNIAKRKIRAERRRQKSEVKKFSRELELWEALMNSSRDTEREDLKNIVRFYVQEIADSYKPIVRDSLMKIVAPIRLLSGGLKFRSVTPHIGGEVEKVRQLADKYNILYTPRHQSHLDSVELAYALNKLGLPIPRYAAAINLMSSPFWEWMLKSLGAYAVDRERTRNSVYLECLSIYSTLLLESGIPSLVYPEGTRSRTGGIVPVKTGILKTALDAFRNTGSEIVILPIAISYETVPEDAEFCGIPEKLSMGDYLKKRTSVYLDFCEPIPISKHIGSDDPSTSIATEIAANWCKYHRILPNQIVARILTEHDFQIPTSRIQAAIEDFVYRNPGNYLTTDIDSIYDEGISRLKKMHLVEEKNKMFIAIQTDLVKFYGNMVPVNIEQEF